MTFAWYTQIVSALGNMKTDTHIIYIGWYDKDMYLSTVPGGG